MKKQLNLAESFQMGVNMTPMIDIVFILLIFFMVINNNRQRDFSDLSLPISTVGADLTPKLSIDRLVFTIDAETRQILLDGRPLTPKQAAERIARAVKYNPDTNVVIRNHQSAACGTSGGRLINICAARGVRNVSVAVTRQDDEP